MMSQTKSIRILLVEDDPKLCKLVKNYLEQYDYTVDIEMRGNRAPERILTEKPDLIILDLMLPGLNGVTICEEVRSKFNNPILMLTALGEESDELAGLEAGADDYLVKPVKPQRLLARIKALLRRTSRTNTSHHLIVLSSITVDANQRVAEVEGREINLTTAEFDLLWLLASHAGEVVTRDNICTELRGFDYDGLDRTIDLRVTRLRKKLGDDGRNPQLIKSIRSVGYMLVGNR